ncbi:exocyst complex component EXO70I-like [Phoenix dactylifera]|uniref:Exocyst subunit Exo70 family protein n=1 Tax=Phoenix dactylifera TaxID=42345 RepID=A0A8B7CV14_PHODC|nr:exocyst complex component EXO70I-like [Phoenix dactylifera]
MAVDDNDEAVIAALRASRSNIVSILRASARMDKGLAAVDARLSLGLESLDAVTEAVAPLQSQAMATKALHARINRAVPPALSLLRSFALVESLQRRLLRLSSRTSSIPRLVDFVECVDRLRETIAAVTAGCEPAVQRLHEAVEFLSRTRATDQLRIHRLRETLVALEQLYEAEVDGLRYDGPLDDALLRLQNDYEAILDLLKHRYIAAHVDGGDDTTDPSPPVLGSELEIEALRRISETLASNDCLDICIDIFVKVRYRRAAKALMRLSPEYLRAYAPEEIDGMEWEGLEAAISLWIHHFEVAVRLVLAAEKRLCRGALGGVMDGAVWPECFAKIADRIMAVFFRFGEGVARSSNEPQKLFKLLDMLDALDRIRPAFISTFDGEAGGDIRARCRELQKLLVHAAARAFWELGLKIEGLQDRAPPPRDGSVPKIVRYAVNYLKCLAGGGYAASMERVLRTEAVWKAGPLAARPDAEEEDLLSDALSNVLEALQRNVEAKRGEYGSRDRVVPHVMAMNAYWYIYMRTRGSELAALVGEETMRRRFKTAAEEAAYSYQEEAWGPLVRLLTATGDVEAFMMGLDENLRRHRSGYCVPDGDLREQIKEAVAKVVVEAYAGFLHANAGVVVEGRAFLPPDAIKRYDHQALPLTSKVLTFMSNRV